MPLPTSACRLVTVDCGCSRPSACNSYVTQPLPPCHSVSLNCKHPSIVSRSRSANSRARSSFAGRSESWASRSRAFARLSTVTGFGGSHGRLHLRACCKSVNCGVKGHSAHRNGPKMRYCAVWRLDFCHFEGFRLPIRWISRAIGLLQQAPKRHAPHSIASRPRFSTQRTPSARAYDWPRVRRCAST